MYKYVYIVAANTVGYPKNKAEILVGRYVKTKNN